MQFSMVMIICFVQGACQTIFDTAKFNSYNDCISAANGVVRYMMETYPTSKGEVKCLDEMEIIELKDLLEKK
jgi:hypothetical protein